MADSKPATKKVAIEDTQNIVNIGDYEPPGISASLSKSLLEVPGLDTRVCQYHLIPRQNNKAVETNAIQDPKLRALLLDAQNGSGVGGPVSLENHPMVPRHLFTGGKLVFLDCELWWFRREHYNQVMHGAQDLAMETQAKRALRMDDDTPDHIRKELERMFRQERQNMRRGES